jgi:hypothetical protein
MSMSINQHFGLVVDVADRLVEDRDRRIRDDGPRDGDALALPTRDLRPALTDLRVVAVAEFRDEPVTPASRAARSPAA